MFKHVKGVAKVVSGYAGGSAATAEYETVSSGRTGHAESVQITFDSSQITYGQLLRVFFSVAHDPTELNRQGPDEGTQYRSAIFHHTEEQKALAEKYKRELDASGAFERPIVTEIRPVTKFFKAEEYHQNYYLLNPQQGYCRYVIAPKVDKFRKVFADALKKDD